jgi:hypothetical protein
MKRLMVLLSLILIVVFSGCGDQDIPTVSDIKDGIKIIDFSFDSSIAYAGDTTGLTLEVQNVGEIKATITDLELFGPLISSVPVTTNWYVDPNDPSPKIIGNGLSPSEPDFDIEGQVLSTRWNPEAPSNIKTETPYSFGVRVTYDYETNYEGKPNYKINC